MCVPLSSQRRVPMPSRPSPGIHPLPRYLQQVWDGGSIPHTEYAKPLICLTLACLVSMGIPGSIPGLEAL